MFVSCVLAGGPSVGDGKRSSQTRSAAGMISALADWFCCVVHHRVISADVKRRPAW
jgi:hypothetical protein